MADISTHIEAFQALIQTNSPDDQALMMQALEFAQRAHHGQKRKSGEPYFSHPLSVAYLLHEKYQDAELTAAAFLHDTAEDCEDVSMSMLYEIFGERIGFLIDAVTKKPLYFYQKESATYGDRIEKLLAGGMHDVRVLLLKLADRHHNVSTLASMSNFKKIRISFETQAVYTPLSELLDFDASHTIASRQECWNEFLKKNNLMTPEKIKAFLYQYYFEDCTNDMFDIAYRHPEKLIWQLKDKEQFRKLCADPNFEKNAHIVELDSDGTHFRALFQFVDGHLIDDQDTKLSFSI
jgi:(p)ppGpp synthase/HD superfamily hydrolase